MSQPTRLHQYEEIARQLRQQIRRGDFRHDGRLPAERALGKQFAVQRNTVRQALALLEKEGSIWIDPKRGSFIKSQEPDANRNVFLVNIHSGSTPTLSQLMDGFTSVSERAGYLVRRVNTDPPAGEAIDPLPDARNLPSDTAGIVLWPQNPTDAESIFRLNAVVPLVLVDRRVLGVSADCVHFDDVAGGRMVTEHLLQQGHRRIAFLTDDVFAETVQNRWRGYVTALQHHGVPVDPKLGVFFNGLHEPLYSMTMRHLLSQGADRPTAIVCSNDLVAFTLLRFLRDEGVKVPDEVVVTGYGNSMPDYLEAMALTSVDQSFYRLGQTAAEILLERVGQSSEERLRDPRDILIATHLVARNSSTGSFRA